MSGAVNLEGTGLEVIDLESDPGFAARQLHAYDAAAQMEGMLRLARAFVENPDTVLQALVEAAVDLCGAESAGISIQNRNEMGEPSYHWVATAGKYAKFLNAILPSFPSACGLCLERGKPQLFRVSQPFFDRMGIEADIVTDGLLIPWQVEEVRGTLWIMAHGRDIAFDENDRRLIAVLASFAAIGAQQQRQQKLIMEQAAAAAAATMANELAHEINNPLQILTNSVYLAAHAGKGDDVKAVAQSMAEPLQRLTTLVAKLLALPIAAHPEGPLQGSPIRQD
jgi:signal transduction histidine kinase